MERNFPIYVLMSDCYVFVFAVSLEIRPIEIKFVSWHWLFSVPYFPAKNVAVSDGLIPCSMWLLLESKHKDFSTSSKETFKTISFGPSMTNRSISFNIAPQCTCVSLINISNGSQSWIVGIFKSKVWKPHLMYYSKITCYVLLFFAWNLWEKTLKDSAL